MNDDPEFVPSKPGSPKSISLSSLVAGGTGSQPTQIVPVKELALREWQGMSTPPTFQQLKGARLTETILWFIFGLTVVFVIGWWITRPTVADVHLILGESAGGKEKLEALQSLRNEYFNVFRDLFQLAVASVLVPIFTLLAGYAFGSREAERRGEPR